MPLGMTSTTAHQPREPRLSNELARGYDWIRGHYEPIPYHYTQTDPAGGISGTASDLGRLMLALLGDGSVDGQRILSSVKLMLQSQYTADPRIAATAYEFMHWTTHGLDLLHKDGTLGDHVAVMLLSPTNKFGVFVASNGPSDIGNRLLERMLTYVVGPAVATPPATSSPDARQRAQLFAGCYRDYHHTWDDMSQIRSLMPMVQSRVSVESDGAIRWQGRRWQIGRAHV